MNLFLLRHGLAVELGSAGFTHDPDRPLLPEGERKLGKITQAMKKLEISFDRILSSPYVRARQTAEIVADGLGLSKKLELCDLLTPGGSPRKLLEQIQRHKPALENVLLVGHEPYLSQLISRLVSGDDRTAVTMKKGGLCKLSIESLHDGRCAVLEWLLGPKQLCLMA